MRFHVFIISCINIIKWNTICIYGKTCQLKHGDLSSGSVALHLNKPMHTRLMKALRTGKGCRLSLSREEIRNNIVKSPSYGMHLTKKSYEEIDGGSIAGDFKKFGRTLNKAIIKPINEQVIKPIVKNKEGILRSVAAVGIPLVTSAVSKYTGLNFNGGNKIMSNYADRRIRRDLGKDKFNIPVYEPSPTSTITAPTIPVVSAIEVGGGSLGFKMVPRAVKKPIGKASVKPKNFDNIKPALDGGALFLPGRGLYLP